MKIEVNENVINKTAHCDHDFLCLSDEWKQCGVVKALLLTNFFMCSLIRDNSGPAVIGSHLEAVITVPVPQE